MFSIYVIYIGKGIYHLMKFNNISLKQYLVQVIFLQSQSTKNEIILLIRKKICLIFVLSIIIKRTHPYNNDIHTCFIDAKKERLEVVSF